MACGHLAAGQGKIVTAFFIGQAEVAAGLLPLGTVCGDAAAASAMVSEEVGEFVAQGAVDLRVAEIAQAGIERDEGFAGVGGAGGAAHARIPAYADARGEVGAAEWVEEGAYFFFQLRGVSRRGCDWSGRGALDRGAETIGELAEKIELHAGGAI
jgi:hypothetical protein